MPTGTDFVARRTAYARPMRSSPSSLRSLPSLKDVLDTVKSAGYQHVELVGSHLDDAGNVRQALDERGLSVSSSHVGMAALREVPGVQYEGLCW